MRLSTKGDKHWGLSVVFFILNSFLSNRLEQNRPPVFGSANNVLTETVIFLSQDVCIIEDVCEPLFLATKEASSSYFAFHILTPGFVLIASLCIGTLSNPQFKHYYFVICWPHYLKYRGEKKLTALREFFFHSEYYTLFLGVKVSITLSFGLRISSAISNKSSRVVKDDTLNFLKISDKTTFSSNSANFWPMGLKLASKTK